MSNKMPCSNCDRSVDLPSQEALVLTQGDRTVAALCGWCQTNVRTAKIVLSRDNVKAQLEYEGYLPAACFQ